MADVVEVQINARVFFTYPVRSSGTILCRKCSVLGGFVLPSAFPTGD